MVDSPNSAFQSPNPSGTGKPQSTGGRQRVISSCLTCRRRKVKCDHVHPVCGSCARGNHTCAYATDQSLGQGASGRVTKSSFTANAKGNRNIDVQARLDRLEQLMEQAVSGSGKSVPSNDHRQRMPNHSKHESEHQPSPSSASQSSHGAGISSDSHDGTLLLDEGQSHFVSSLHYALLADEIQDIKALLGEKGPDEDKDVTTRNNLVHLLSLGRARIGVSLQELLPSSQHRDALLEIYLSNVDPMVRITHTPTLLRKLPHLIHDTRPIVFAIYYSAINSLPPSICLETFGESKDDLLAQYELGVEISLARENYLTTSSLEVLQGLVLWLTCITKEDEMGKAWALLGVTIRIALHQGLHRDPSLFHSDTMDVVTIELRRRLWCQICHLEYRAAECKGQEPSIHDEDFTTLLPRNIDDDELVEGGTPGPGPYDDERFTGMTFQLVRFSGMRALRRIVQSTYRLERRMLESGLHGTSSPDPVRELQGIYEDIKTMVNEMHENNQRRFLRFCNPQIPIHRLCLGLASLLEWRCYLLFWLRMPRAYRDIVFSNDIRISIFRKSVSCVETLNGASSDKDAMRFQWHIGGHSAFQAIMHVLSELQNSLLDEADRQRALQALRMSRMLKEDNTTRAWTVVKGMIDKVAGQQPASQPTPTHSQPSSTYASPTTATITQSTVGGEFSTYIDPTQRYFQPNTNVYGASAPPPVPQPQPFQPLEPLDPQFNWDDVNLNHIVGNPAQQNTELPEFDWGFWGEPVNFNDQINVPFPMDTNVYTPFGT